MREGESEREGERGERRKRIASTRKVIDAQIKYNNYIIVYRFISCLRIILMQFRKYKERDSVEYLFIWSECSMNSVSNFSGAGYF